MPILGEEPARRLWKPNWSNENYKSKDALEGDRKAPSEIWWTISAAIIQPISDKSTKGNNAALNTDEKSTVCSL